MAFFVVNLVFCKLILATQAFTWIGMECWKQLACLETGKNVIIKMKCLDAMSYEFKVSDLHNIWCETLTAQETKSRCADLNPRLEAPIENILEHIKNTLESQGTDDFTVTFDSSNTVKITMKNEFVGGIPFRWEFACYKSEEQCQDVFLSPFGKLVISLQIGIDRLMDIIRRKDDEINDYKEVSRAKVSHRSLETEVFDQEKFIDALRRTVEYQNAINSDIISIITKPSVNNRLQELQKDISNPMPAISSTKGRSIQAKIRGRVKNKRKNIRGPAKGAEIGSDQDDGSGQEAEPKVKEESNIVPVNTNSSRSISSKKRKATDKRKRLF